LVYCVKCGTKNPDDALVCSNCGAQLKVTERSQHYRRMEDECFGLPRGNQIIGIAFGVILIFAGLIWFLQQNEMISRNVELWPFAVIIFGILIVLGAVYGRRGR
jgi:uncharacterized membrane protein YvbJ